MSVRLNIIKISSLIFFFIVACFPLARAQEPNSPVNQNLHQWGAVSLFNGLPSNTVRAIAQTPDGVLWFGTDGGLAKFDGRVVEKVSFPGSDAQIVFALAVSRDGSLWIGTDKGALRFSGGRFYSIEETLEKVINSILIGKDKIFLGSSDAVFKVETGAENSLVISEILNQDLKINALANDENTLLLGSLGRGLISFSGDAAQEIITRPRPFFINVLTRDSQNNLWLGADTGDKAGGLYLANNISRPEIVSGNFGTVTAISSGGASGDLLVGTKNNGLFYLRGGQVVKNHTFANTAGGLHSNRIFTVFVDRERTVWIGTDRGISRYDAQSPFNQIFSEDAASNTVRTLYQAKTGKIYAGTNRGLFTFENGSWQEAENFSQKTVYAAAENQDGEIYIGSSSGLFAFDGEGILSGDVRGIENFQGKIYAAVFGKGLFEIIGESEKLVYENKTITSLSANEKNLLVGTGAGEIFAFDGKQITRSEQYNDLNGSAVWRIRRNKESILFATEKGLFIYQNNSVEKYLTNNVVRDAFFADNGEIWAATIGGGLFHLKYDETFGLLTANLTAEQGLPSASIFALLPLDGGEFLIGTTRGIARYTSNEIPPQIVPTRILSQRLYSEQEMRQGIRLEYPQNSLVLEATGLSSRTFPEQFQYAFLLVNSKGEIIEKRISKEAQFVMDELAAGDYRVEARAFNQDLTASEPLVFNFTVSGAPFPWTSATLAALLGIALIALVWAIVERRRITDTNRKLTHARLDLANEAERERRRIARDLHDQTLADLRNLMLKSDELPGETSQFRGEIENVSEEIRRICEDLSPSVLENVGLLAALEFLLSSTTANYEFTAAENLEEHLDLPPSVQIQIFRIVQEVLSNIKRHAEAERIKMSVSDSFENGFTLEIEDDGRSFETKSAAKKGRGLSNIKSRAALIKAEVAWEKHSDSGTVFTLHKPN
jgi:signal transduction histidine kinase/ligand-binding sensor domain-containing protein